MIYVGSIQSIDEVNKSFILQSRMSDKHIRVPYTDDNFDLVKKNFNQNETTLVDVTIENKEIKSIVVM